MAKLLPKTMNSSHYRFPAQGQNYIEIPHEAFHSQGEHSWGDLHPSTLREGLSPVAVSWQRGCPQASSVCLWEHSVSSGALEMSSQRRLDSESAAA